ncbi:MAG: hypothetical protein ACRD2A_19965, partial [Vicinamibacterales bacterium]
HCAQEQGRALAPKKRGQRAIVSIGCDTVVAVMMRMVERQRLVAVRIRGLPRCCPDRRSSRSSGRLLALVFMCNRMVRFVR